MKNQEIKGQLSLFDIFMPQVDDTPEILLTPGQTIYTVKKGDVFKWEVTPYNWIYQMGTKNRGYDLWNGAGHNVINNDDIGTSAFNTEEEARTIADKYLKEHDVIRAEDIYFDKISAYHYIRELDGYEMISFCAELPNGLLYKKNYGTFVHIVKNTPKEQKIPGTITFFAKQGKSEVMNFIPKPQNMYKCSERTNWLYTEADCSYGIG